MKPSLLNSPYIKEATQIIDETKATLSKKNLALGHQQRFGKLRDEVRKELKNLQNFPQDVLSGKLKKKDSDAETTVHVSPQEYSHLEVAQLAQWMTKKILWRGAANQDLDTWISKGQTGPLNQWARFGLSAQQGTDRFADGANNAAIFHVGQCYEFMNVGFEVATQLVEMFGLNVNVYAEQDRDGNHCFVRIGDRVQFDPWATKGTVAISSELKFSADKRLRTSTSGTEQRQQGLNLELAAQVHEALKAKLQPKELEPDEADPLARAVLNHYINKAARRNPVLSAHMKNQGIARYERLDLQTLTSTEVAEIKSELEKITQGLDEKLLRKSTGPHPFVKSILGLHDLWHESYTAVDPTVQYRTNTGQADTFSGIPEAIYQKQQAAEQEMKDNNFPEGYKRKWF